MDQETKITYQRDLDIEAGFHLPAMLVGVLETNL